MQCNQRRAADIELWGGFVLQGKPTFNGIKKQRVVKKQTELAVLSYVEYLAGVRVRVRKKGGGRSRNVRKEIFRYFFPS